MQQLDCLKRTVKGITFPYPLMVAGGVVKTVEQSIKLAKADVLAEFGSATTRALPGNGGRDYWAVYVNGILVCTFNSVGLLNPGMDYVEKHADTLIKAHADYGMPFWLNVSGNGPEDTLSLLKRALKAGIKVITVNGACPNKKDQPILCDDPFAVDEVFDRADREIGDTDAIVLWKVSCGMRRPTLSHNRERVRTSRVFTGAITGNTVPNGLGYLPNGETMIKTDNGLDRGGMAGPAIFPIALDHTQFMADGMPAGKIVIGAGGIDNIEKITHMFKAGAAMVQTNSGFREAGEDPDFIRDLNRVLLELSATA